MDDRQRACTYAVQLWQAGDLDRFWLYMRKLDDHDRGWWLSALSAVNKFTKNELRIVQEGKIVRV